MRGFSFSLKANKVTKDKQTKASVALPKKRLLKKNTLFNDDDIPPELRTSIDAFGAKEGAMMGTTAVSKLPVLVIEPINKTHSLRKRALGLGLEESNGNTGMIDSREPPLAEDKARRSILARELFHESNNKIIPGHDEEYYEIEAETAQEDYETVPVDQFGAALLRGMGWLGELDARDSANNEIHNRKQGAVLGIGAKAIEKDLEAELLSKKNLGVPLIRRTN